MTGSGLELRWLTPGDEAELVLARPLFDHAVSPERARTFLNQPGHHLCLAFQDGTAVGFVSGVEMFHPDKGREMFLYELGVGEDHRRSGLGSSLVGSLVHRAKDLDCYGMWVLTEEDNIAACRTYLAAGAENPPEPCVLFNWTFGDPRDGTSSGGGGT